VVSGDPDRLRQLSAILIDNAIRHSPRDGTVLVTIGSSGSNGRATLSVDDDGPGIRDEDLPHLFDRFWRAADAPSGGTGLGLSIAAWIAERHEGSIVASNRSTGGAHFEVSIPKQA
jgi:signal transduction histidine kinase